MKSIKELVSEAGDKYEDKRYKEQGDQDPYNVSVCFNAGATFATDLVWERVVEALRNYQDKEDFNFADLLVKNREKIIGNKNE